MGAGAGVNSYYCIILILSQRTHCDYLNSFVKVVLFLSTRGAIIAGQVLLVLKLA